MADVTGIKIADLTEFGSTQDGEHVWITHRLGDGSEYPLIYPYEAVGYLLTVLADAARSAYRLRAARNPQEAAEGMDTNTIAVEEVRIGTTATASGAILHMTTADKIPIAVEISASLVRNLSKQLNQLIAKLDDAVPSGTRLH